MWKDAAGNSTSFNMDAFRKEQAEMQAKAAAQQMVKGAIAKGQPGWNTDRDPYVRHLFLPREQVTQAIQSGDGWEKRLADMQSIMNQRLQGQAPTLPPAGPVVEAARRRFQPMPVPDDMLQRRPMPIERQPYRPPTGDNSIKRKFQPYQRPQSGQDSLRMFLEMMRNSRNAKRYRNG